MKSPVIFIYVIAILLLFVAGIGYFVPGNSFPPESPSTNITASPRESKPSTEPPPLSFEQKIESLKQAIANVCATGVSEELTLVFTETEANDQAAKLLATTEMPQDVPLEIESVHIDFQADNNVLVEVKTVIYSFKPTIKVKAQVGIEQGKPEVEISDISFGFIPLPKPLKDKIVDLITQKTDDLQSQFTEKGIGCDGKIDLEFTNLNVQQEKVTITVMIKPQA